MHAVIRELSPRHYDYFRSLRQEALDQAPESFSSDSLEWRDAPQETITSMLHASETQHGARILGAFTDDLVGMIGLKQPRSRKTRHCITLWGLYVSPAERRKGIGRALLKTALESAFSLPEAKYVRVMVAESHTEVHKLITGVGFQKYGIEKQARHIRDEQNDKYLDLAYFQCLKPVQP